VVTDALINFHIAVGAGPQSRGDGASPPASHRRGRRSADPAAAAVADGLAGGRWNR